MHATTLPRAAPGGRLAPAALDTRARRAIELGLNVLASSAVVSGSALDGLADVARVDASGIEDPRTLLSSIRAALRVDPVSRHDAAAEDTYDLIVGLAKQLWASERRPALVLENPETPVAMALFGRLRDELWDVPLRWLVVVPATVGAALDRPPANAFFEVALA